MPKTAYALKEAWADNPDVGGTMRRDATAMINVGERLRKGRGYIVTEDQAEIDALDQFDPLKRVAVSEAEKVRQSVPSKKAGDDKGEEK